MHKAKGKKLTFNQLIPDPASALVHRKETLIQESLKKEFEIK